MQSCSIPNEWKIHKIVLIPNSSDLSKVQNYRPISLLCILSKTLELIIYNKIIDFIRPLISKRQFGFLKIALESRKPCDVVFLNFRKAFDTIPLPELLFKLWTHGITGPLWKW